jgi:hypothetical protein
MNADDYFWKTKKRPAKSKQLSKSLPKAKEKFLEAEETLFQELEEQLIGYERKFEFTKNWRFDFYIVKLRLLTEIAGCPWAVGRCGNKIANVLSKYDVAIDMGYTFEGLETNQIEFGYAIRWIQS